MSYEYKIFRCNGAAPKSFEDFMEGGEPTPFESYESVKRIISGSFPEIEWNDGSGIAENDIGRFEFQCDEDGLAIGIIFVETSFRQDVFQSHDALRKLCRNAGWFALDDQTMEIIG